MPQSDSLCEVRKRLRQNGIEYVEDTVLEDGIRIHQVRISPPFPSTCAGFQAADT